MFSFSIARPALAARFLVLPPMLALACALGGCATEPAGPGPGATADWAPAVPNQPAPYPSESKLNNEQGQVLLQVLTAPDGRPTRVEVKQTSGFQRLDQAAVATVKQWRFKPLGDAAATTWREVPITFRLGAQNAELPR
ncbi:energy transducer TonB [Variovorax saccharolyticus]|uniref:energy transducer TonB n=1 Tax=Variovorax saccharolyticus TaxID=3053516 RepID=UPI0025781336|nr:energy transducer TonB [Variovorax sp. J31P216]MDM0023019.1 energy transducer TonB [Variovorax sp. J31P216]